MTDSNNKSLARWLRDRWESRNATAELESLASSDLERIAHEVGVGSSELREIAGLGSHAADLLPRRMEAVGLDAAEVARTDPATLHDLQRVCAMCASKGQCIHDLDHPASAGTLPDYCLNRDTLRELGVHES